MSTTTVPVKVSKTPAEPGALSGFPEIEKLLNKIEKRAFELFANRGFDFGRELDDWLTAERELAFVPPAELTETESEYKVEIAAPGIPADKLQVDVLPSCIIVEGAAGEKKEEKKGNVIFSEFKNQKLFRKFELPAKIDAGSVKANLENGVLRIVASKAAAETPKRISVAAA